jgi:hypothetical protein
VRLVFCLIPIAFLTACGAPAGIPYSDLAIAGAALGVVYSDEISEAVEKPEDVSPDDVLPGRTKSTTTRIANHVRDNVKATGKHVKEWWSYDPNAKKEVKTIPNSYCYRAQGDVLCYRAPMPGWEHRLVGYQGTFAQAPPPVMMQPLPGQKLDTSLLPASRVANAKPVFTELPPEAKEEVAKDPTQLLEADPQNVQETIQDPSISPQL